MGDPKAGPAIAGDALICQERRTSFSVDELRGFTREGRSSSGTSSLAGPEAATADS